MKLINEIIESISGNSFSLTDALIKTKVLSFELKNEELKTWINNELNGYPSEELPNYRVIPCQVIGSISNGFHRATNYPIPLTALDKEEKEQIITVRLYQSISSLDDIVNKGDNSKMVMNVPPEMYAYLSQDLDNGFVIEYARREISKTQIIQILTSVRTKLLDFLLELREEFGNSDDITNFTKGKGKETVNSIFSSSVFGNNTTIIVGDSNVQTLTNSNNYTGNFEELSKQLIEKGVSESDIEDLRIAINDDNPDSENKKFGQKVNAWILKMMSKAMDSSWEVGIGAAGNLLAEGVTRYYGWK